MLKPNLLAVSFLLLLSSYCHALQIRSYSDSRHLRFTSFPGSPAENSNTNFIANGVDLSGVGWYAQDLRRQYTLVSPKHFVGANHFRPSNSGQLKFLSADGTVKTYEIASSHAILNGDGDPTDLFIGKLENVISESDQVSFLPFLSLPSEGNYTGQTVLFMGHRIASPKNLRIGTGVIGSFTNLGADPITSGSPFNSTRAYQMTYSNIGFGGDDAYAEGGDSGAPSLVPVDGKGALVGTHSAVANASINLGLAIPGSTITYDSFVPHYIDELNAIMAPDGYHMTRAVPGAVKPTTTLELSITQPAVIRAGYPFSVTMSLENTGATEDANNIKLSGNLPSQPTASGNLWVSSVDGNSVNSRRGGIPAQSASDDLNLELLMTRPGSFDSGITFSADEFKESNQPFTIEVIESFLSWSSALTNKSRTGDDDGDNINNLLEYAFGGDPTGNSQLVPGTNTLLLPRMTRNENSFSVQYIRRKDAEDRGLTYQILSSQDLSPESWLTAIPDSSSSSSLNDELEIVTATFTPDSISEFFRIGVSLSE